MSKEQQTATWIFMILSAIRKRFNMPHTDIIPLTKKYRIFNFLAEQYELLHYYDNDYIVDDVISYIKEQGGDLHELRRTA